MKPKERVNLPISIIDTGVHICADALKNQDEPIKEEELPEKVRGRIVCNRR